MVRYRGVHHPAFATRDILHTTRFWRDLLGLRLVYTVGEPGNRQYFFALSERDYIVFFEWPEVEPVPYRHPGTPGRGPMLFDHLCIEVDSLEDLWALAERLDGAGVPVTDAVDHGLLTSLYTFDPNGLPLEFTVPEPGVDVRQHPTFAEADPSLAACEGCSPRPGHWPDPDPIPEHLRQPVPGEGYDVFKGESC